MERVQEKNKADENNKATSDKSSTENAWMFKEILSRTNIRNNG